MGETAGAGAHAVGSAAAIGRLRQQIQGLIDADLILLEDGRCLMATLERTLQGLATADLRASRSGMRGFIERLEVLIQRGDLEAADGETPVEMARELLAALRGEGRPPAGRTRPATAQRDRTTGIRKEVRVGISVVPPPALSEE